MKTLFPFNPSSHRRRGEHGYVVITVLAILSVLLIYIMVNVRYLRDLNRELKLFEREQIHRLQKSTLPPSRISLIHTNGIESPIAVISPRS